MSGLLPLLLAWGLSAPLTDPDEPTDPGPDPEPDEPDEPDEPEGPDDDDEEGPVGEPAPPPADAANAGVPFDLSDEDRRPEVTAALPEVGRL